MEKYHKNRTIVGCGGRESTMESIGRGAFESTTTKESE